MVKCIICGEPITEVSPEHIIPDAIGGTIVIHSVCKECNSRLGDKVDCLLTDDLLFYFIRTYLGIKNRNGDTGEEPFIRKLNRSLPEDQRIRIRSGDGRDMPYLYDVSSKPYASITTNGKKGIVQFNGPDMQSVITKVIRELKSNCIPFSEDQITQKIRESANESRNETVFEADIPFLPENYRLCLLKMAYEIMCTLFEAYSEDPIGQKIQRYLHAVINDTEAEIPEGVSAGWISSLPRLQYYSEIVDDSDNLTIRIGLFGVFIGEVMVSQNPERYDLSEYSGKNLFEVVKEKRA